MRIFLHKNTCCERNEQKAFIGGGGKLPLARESLKRRSRLSNPRSIKYLDEKYLLRAQQGG